MHVVTGTFARTGRPLLALSFVCFAAAGATNTTLGVGVHSAVAITLVAGGCYTLARYANLVSRKQLATVSIALWFAFLAVSVLHAIGLGTVTGLVPLPAGAVTIALDALTWSTLLSAAVSTAFLGFREYASGTATDTPEELLDGDVEY